MRKLSLIFIMIVSGANVFAQAPEMINYQAVVRDLSGNSITNQLVGVRISILQGSTAGPEVFAETQGPTTNSYGLINMQIGTGANIGSPLSSINWGSSTFFIRIEIDPTGGTSYSVSSTSQLLSVPFALYAKTAGNVNDADFDPTNEFNTGAIINADSLEITDGGGTLVVDLSTVKQDPDMDPNNEIQTLSKVGQIVTLSSGGGAFTDDVDDADNNPTNEFNATLTLVGTTLQLADGGGTLNADLTSIQDDADADPTNEFNTSILLIGSTLFVTDGGGTIGTDLSSIQNDADSDPTNEYNTSVNLVGTILQVTDGGGVLNVDLTTLGDDPDADPTNEIQTLSQVSNIVTLSNGGGFVDINDSDADATNEFNTAATLTGTNLNITDGGGTFIVDMSSLVGGGDPSSVNELNSGASLTGTVLSITDPGGNVSVDLVSLQDGVNDADSDPTNEYNSTVVLNGTNLETTDGGGTIITDLSSLGGAGDPSSTNELNTGASLTGTILSITDPGGNVSVDLVSLQDGVNDADFDPTNEYNSTVVLNGTNLETTDGGGTIVTDLSSLGGAGATFSVGQLYQGGVIVFVDSTGTGGLIAGKFDIETDIEFEPAPNTIVLYATSHTDGAANTASLVAGFGAGTYAAMSCDSYSFGGFSDWFLPSIYELELIFRSNYVMGVYALDWQGANFYWSSTQDPSGAGFNAYEVQSNAGIVIQSTSEAGDPTVQKVRPMRAF
jgi:hypothetical protein